MSLPDRRAVLACLATLAILGGCGFRPLHGPGSGLRGTVRVDAGSGRDSFEMVEAVEARLGAAPAGARFTLEIAPRIVEEELTLAADATITRYRLEGSARYRLNDSVSGESVTEGEVSARTSFSTTASPLSARAAERDARRRLVGLLADRIVARLEAGGIAGG